MRREDLRGTGGHPVGETVVVVAGGRDLPAGEEEHDEQDGDLFGQAVEVREGVEHVGEDFGERVRGVVRVEEGAEGGVGGADEGRGRGAGTGVLGARGEEVEEEAVEGAGGGGVFDGGAEGVRGGGGEAGVRVGGLKGDVRVGGEGRRGAREGEVLGGDGVVAVVEEVVEGVLFAGGGHVRGGG